MKQVSLLNNEIEVEEFTFNSCSWCNELRVTFELNEKFCKFFFSFKSIYMQICSENKCCLYVDRKNQFIIIAIHLKNSRPHLN